MSMLSVGLDDFQNVGMLSIECFGVNVAAYVVALTIDKLVHKIFKVEPGTPVSHVIKACALGAGIGVCVYLAPQTFIERTWRQFLEMLLVSVLVTAVFSKVTTAIDDFVAKTMEKYGCPPSDNFKLYKVWFNGVIGIAAGKDFAIFNGASASFDAIGGIVDYMKGTITWK